MISNQSQIVIETLEFVEFQKKKSCVFVVKPKPLGKIVANFDFAFECGLNNI